MKKLITTNALWVLRSINGNGGEGLSGAKLRIAEHLVDLGYARGKSPGHYKISATGRKLLEAAKKPNPYGGVGAW